MYISAPGRCQKRRKVHHSQAQETRRRRPGEACVRLDEEQRGTLVFGLGLGLTRSCWVNPGGVKTPGGLTQPLTLEVALQGVRVNPYV